ncbi:MAG: WD40 repeat domain-containing serine/threonine-protein kinase, partial [Fuerstiella sp.]
MSKKNPSENETPRQSPVYGTQLPAFGKNQPESAPAAGEAEREPDAGSKMRPAFGTQMAPPIAEAVGQRQVQRDLPPQESLRHVSSTYQAGDSQLTQVLHDARAQIRTMPMQDAGNFAVAAPALQISTESGRESQPRRSTRRVAGKSTWNLRIPERGIAGDISGVMNEIPTDPSTATGLQSALTVDDSVPEYEVTGELGAGNMGIVYRARQTSLNRELAIKTLKPDTLNVDHDQAMFVSEAVVTANLVHPNIVPIHDMGRTKDGKLFYSMKQVTGTPWNTTVRELSLEDNVEILMKVSDAVAFAHSQGVINRDLKPENVIVGNYGEVIVLDWGLAITTERFSGKDSVVVDFRGGAGTPVYMPPELADEDVSRVGPHSDIYLLGAMLFEVLEGFPPHLLRESWDLDDPHEQLNAVIRAVLNNEIEPNVMNEGELMEIARTAMSTAPQDRYSSVEQFQDAIREYRITGRAEELMHKVELKGTTSYSEYQSAVALYAEALRKWPHNRRAIDGDQKARQAYAEFAHTKGDIDLGLQVIPDEDNRRFAATRSKLKKARRVRTIVRRTWTLLFVSMVVLTGVTVWMDQELLTANTSLAEKKAEMAEAEEKQAEAEEATTIAAAAQERAEDKAKIAEADKKAAVAEADDKVAEAEGLAEAARKKQDMAEAATTLAETATRLAEDKQATATVKADKATKLAATAKADAEKVKAEADDKVAKAAQDEYDALIKVLGSLEFVRNFDDMVKLIETALENPTNNPVFKENEEFLRRKKMLIERSRGNAAFQVEDKLNNVVASSDGSTLVLRSAEKISVYRDFGDDQNVASGNAHQLHLTAKGRINDIEVSSHGNVVCAVGKGLAQAWVWNKTQYADLTLDSSAGDSKATFQQCIFSLDEKHLYLLDYRSKITVEVYQVSQGTARLLARQPLFSSAVKGAVAVALLPEESGLIVATGNHNCRFVPMRWGPDGVDITEQGKRNIDAVFPKLNDLKDLGQHKGTRFKPEQIVLSPDGSRMALIDGTRFFVLGRDPNAGADQFPYLRPGLTEGFRSQIIKCKYDTNVISTACFSFDSSRFVTSQSRYLQIWEREGDAYTYVSSPADGLYAGNSLAGHGDRIRFAGFLGQSSNRLISHADDDTIRVWDVKTYPRYVEEMKELVHVLGQQTARPDSMSHIPGNGAGRHAVIAVAASGERGISNQGKRLPPLSSDTIAVSPSTRPSRYILTGAPQETLNTARQFRQARKIYSSEFSQDSSRLIIGANDLAAHVFDSKTGEKTGTASMVPFKDLFFEGEKNIFLEGHLPEIVSLRFLPPNGDLLLTSDYFGSISVWDAKDDEDGIGFERSRLLPQDSSCEIAVSRDGKYIVSGGVKNDNNPDIATSKDEFFAMIWKTEDLGASVAPTHFRKLENEHDVRITAAAFSPSGDRVITAGRRGQFVLWDVQTGEVLARIFNAHNSDGVSGVFFTSDNEYVSTGFDGTVRRWTISEDKLDSKVMARANGQRNPDFVIRLRPSPDGSTFITSDLTKDSGDTYRLELNVWSSATGWIRTLPFGIVASTDDVGKPYRHDMSWSEDGSEVLYVHDGRLLVLDATTWKVKSGHSIKGTQAAVRGAFAPGADGGSRIATFDGRFAKMWDLETGENLAEFRSHGPEVRASFSADRQFVVTGSDSIRVFNADENSPEHGRTVFRLPRQVVGRRLIDDVCFSHAEGDYRFASIDSAGAVKVWDWKAGGPPPEKPIAQTGEPSMPVAEWLEDEQIGVANVIRWSDDGQFVVAIQRGQLQMWKIRQDQLVKVEIELPVGAEYTFNCIAFSADNSMLTAGGLAYTEDGNLESRSFVWKISAGGAKHIATISAADQHSVAQRSDQQGNVEPGGITAIAFDDRQNNIITGGADSKVLLWQMSDPDSDEVESLGYLAELEGLSGDGFEDPHDVAVTSLNVASDGSLVSTDEDGFIVIWPA